MHYHHRAKWGIGVFGFMVGALTWAAFGPKIKRRLGRSRAWQELKNEVMEESRRVKDLTQSRYERIVDDVGQKYGKVRNISQNELKDLLSDLKLNWNKIKDAWRSDSNHTPDDFDSSDGQEEVI
ncbi:MAG: hypothetical protein ACM3KM_04055 [Acidobacteriaceae bacterium]